MSKFLMEKLPILPEGYTWNVREYYRDELDKKFDKSSALCPDGYMIEVIEELDNTNLIFQVMVDPIRDVKIQELYTEYLRTEKEYLDAPHGVLTKTKKKKVQLYDVHEKARTDMYRYGTEKTAHELSDETILYNAKLIYSHVKDKINNREKSDAITVAKINAAKRSSKFLGSYPTIKEEVRTNE